MPALTPESDLLIALQCLQSQITQQIIKYQMDMAVKLVGVIWNYRCGKIYIANLTSFIRTSAQPAMTLGSITAMPAASNDLGKYYSNVCSLVIASL